MSTKVVPERSWMIYLNPNPKLLEQRLNNNSGATPRNKKRARTASTKKGKRGSRRGQGGDERGRGKIWKGYREKLYGGRLERPRKRQLRLTGSPAGRCRCSLGCQRLAPRLSPGMPMDRPSKRTMESHNCSVGSANRTTRARPATNKQCQRYLETSEE